MSEYCTTQDILDYDSNARNLTATPDSPNFAIQIGFISDEIDMKIKNAHPGLTSADVDTTQYKIICINGVLALLWRSAVLARGSAAQYAAEEYRKTFSNLLQSRIELVNGETIKPGVGRAYRS